MNQPKPEIVVDGIRVIHETPPVWANVCATFGVIPATAVFTYNDRIYNPCGAYLPDHIVVHERVHIKQQGGTDESAGLWWGKFLRDPAFRLDQESEAYAVQYAYVCKQQKDRNVRHNFLLNLARVLSGPMYGNCIGMQEALNLIKSRANVPK